MGNRKCANCAEILEEGEVFCGNCGTRYVEAAPTPAEPVPDSQMPAEEIVGDFFAPAEDSASPSFTEEQTQVFEKSPQQFVFEKPQTKQIAQQPAFEQAGPQKNAQEPVPPLEKSGKKKTGLIIGVIAGAVVLLLGCIITILAILYFTGDKRSNQSSTISTQVPVVSQDNSLNTNATSEPQDQQNAGFEDQPETQPTWTMEPVQPTQMLAPTHPGNSGTSQQSEWVVLIENFEDNSSGWEIGDYGAAGSVGYLNSYYFVQAPTSGSPMWGTGGFNYSDMHIVVDAWVVESPTDDANEYGVICRAQENGDGYYFGVSGDGSYTVSVAKDGTFTYLVDWTPSDAVGKRNQNNELIVYCDGPNLVFVVNNTELANLTDATFSSGDVALYAVTYGDGVTEVNFDGFIMEALE